MKIDIFYHLYFNSIFTFWGLEFSGRTASGLSVLSKSCYTAPRWGILSAGRFAGCQHPVSSIQHPVSSIQHPAKRPGMYRKGHIFELQQAKGRPLRRLCGVKNIQYRTRNFQCCSIFQTWILEIPCWFWIFLRGIFTCKKNTEYRTRNSELRTGSIGLACWRI